MLGPWLIFLILLVLPAPDPAHAQFSGGEDGLWPKIGGFPPDSGFGLGVTYRKSRLVNGLLDFRSEANLSLKKYERAEIGLDLPRLWNNRLFVESRIQYRNYPEENYWGLGPDSSEGRRGNFRLEDVLYKAAFGARPLANLRTGVSFGRLDVNTGPGKDRAFLSIEKLFTSGNTPGLERQPDYFEFGSFAEYDYRDRPLDPRAGGFYQLRWFFFDDRDFGQFSFRRYEVDVRQFFPVAFKRDTIAFRAFTSLTDTSPGQQVPFFIQRTVGGADSLRGFHQYRFRDKNLLLFNLEYRWAVHSQLEVVSFGDAGKVFSNRSDFGLNEMEGSFGLGGRIKFRKRVFLRVDVGVGREGVRFWLRGSHSF